MNQLIRNILIISIKETAREMYSEMCVRCSAMEEGGDMISNKYVKEVSLILLCFFYI